MVESSSNRSNISSTSRVLGSAAVNSSEGASPSADLCCVHGPRVNASISIPVRSYSPSALPGEFAASHYKAAEQRLGKLLRDLVQSSSSDLHLRVGEPPMFRTHGEIKRQDGPGLSVNDLELLEIGRAHV